MGRHVSEKRHEVGIEAYLGSCGAGRGWDRCWIPKLRRPRGFDFLVLEFSRRWQRVDHIYFYPATSGGGRGYYRTEAEPVSLSPWYLGSLNGKSFLNFRSRIVS